MRNPISSALSYAEQSSRQTISRITNWAEMGEIERDRAVRIMVKRNQIRLRKLEQENKDTDSGEERLSALKDA